MCREAQLAARAEDMPDPVTKGIEMFLIRYSPDVNTIEVWPQPDGRLMHTEGAEEEAGHTINDQRERLMARMRKRIRQV